MSEGRVWHVTVGGNAKDAIKYGLTLRAKCGVVFQPKYLGEVDDRPEIPNCPGCHRPAYVYRCYDADDRLIYVGCSVAPKTRIDQHRKQSWWFPQVARVRFTVFPTKDYALAVEERAIADENPRWNIRGRSRGLWTADDYRDAYAAMSATGAGEKRIERLQHEAFRRYQIQLSEESA